MDFDIYSKSKDDYQSFLHFQMEKKKQDKKSENEKKDDEIYDQFLFIKFSPHFLLT